MEDPTSRIEALQQKVGENSDSVKKKQERIQKIYDQTIDKMIEPGFYTVTETDYGGMREEEVFSFELKRRKNLKDIALDLIADKNYMSPWNDLTIKPYKPLVSTVIR